MHLSHLSSKGEMMKVQGRPKKKMKRLDMLLRDEIKDLTLPSHSNALDNDESDDGDDIHDIHVGVGGYEDDDMAE
ncbi:hypothetical protein M0R45_019122 [Rubus argutus]|uniref:Uncharacterized protein n=1 Tax=Rubus argutus TaxID=59490 RepID=A0AAW1X6G2_RUBAR